MSDEDRGVATPGIDTKKTTNAKKTPVKKPALKRVGPKTAKKKSKVVAKGTRGVLSKRTFPQYGLEDCYNLANAIPELVIVDLTEHNPNVLFELGMRIAFDKPVCLIRAKETAPIFDIDHMLRVYNYNPSMWPSTLEIDIPVLSTHIGETWKKRDTDRSYLKILRDNKDA